MFPAVSILMRTKDRPLFLARGLRSVLAQTERDWQLVIINDGGDRGRIDFLLQSLEKELAGRALVLDFPYPEGRGTGRHLNAGLEMSESEFVAIHDDDDQWHPQFLEKTIARIRSGGECAVVTQTVLVKEKEEEGKLREISRSPYEPWQKDAISLFRLAETLTFPPIALLFRRSVLKETGNFSPELGPLEDWEFALRLFSRFEVPFLEEPLAFYHQRENGEGNTRTRSDISYGRLDTELRNELLRRDLAEGKVGLGFLVNMAQMQERLYREIRSEQE